MFVSHVPSNCDFIASVVYFTAIRVCTVTICHTKYFQGMYYKYYIAFMPLNDFLSLSFPVIYFHIYLVCFTLSDDCSFFCSVVAEGTFLQAISDL